MSAINKNYLWLLLLAATSAWAEVKEFIPYENFLAQNETANYQQYADLPATKVASREAFAEMKSHVLQTYYKVEVDHSFVFPGAGHVDCINLYTQPGLRRGDGFDKPAVHPVPAGLMRIKANP